MIQPIYLLFLQVKESDMKKYKDKEEEIIKLWRTGEYSASEIGRQLNIPRTTLHGLLKELGLWKKKNHEPYTEEQIQQMIDTYNECHNVWKAGEILGISGQTIYKYVSKICKMNINNWTEEEINILREEYSKSDTDFSLDKLGELLHNRSKVTICDKAGQLGLTGTHKPSGEVFIALNIPGRWSNGNHPKGMLNKSHSTETKEIIGLASKASAATVTEEEWKIRGEKATATKIEKYGNANPGFVNSITAYSRTKKGRREDLDDTYFRSSWEANYARYLNYLISQGTIKEWKFEAKTFLFEKSKVGPKSYLPDFMVTNIDGSIEYHEIKGWMDDKSKSKLKKMSKYYPNIVLILIDQKEYKKLEKIYKYILPNWELPAKPVKK